MAKTNSSSGISPGRNDSQVDLMAQQVSEIHKVIYGNGDTDKSLVVRVARHGACLKWMGIVGAAVVAAVVNKYIRK